MVYMVGEQIRTANHYQAMTTSEAINLLGVLTPLILGLGGGVWVKRLINRKAEEMHPSKELMGMIAENMVAISKEFPKGAIKALDIEFKDGDEVIRVVAPLVMDHWVEVGMGVSVQGISSTQKRTVYHLKVANSWGLKTHRHAEAESVKVLSGQMIDRKTGKVYNEGDIWNIEREAWHSVTFVAPNSAEPCFVQIPIKPPLKDVDDDNPLQLKNAAQLVGLAT